VLPSSPALQKGEEKKKTLQTFKECGSSNFGLLMSQQLLDEPLMRISVSADSAFVVGRVFDFCIILVDLLLFRKVKVFDMHNFS
jgi:hypothetical protein